MYHLVVKPYDPSLDYVDFCRKAFGENKCLAMLEKKGGDHLHIQGIPAVGNGVLGDLKEGLTMNHYRKKAGDACHPVKKRKREADDMGFQYMAKELPSSVVVYKQGFTDEDLQELYEKSEKYREELQSQLGEYLRDRCGSGADYRTPRDLHKRLCVLAIEYYMDLDKMPPPNLKALVRYNMAKHYRSPAVVEYLSEALM